MKTTAEPKLKPCPFCGSKNVEIFKPVNSIHIKPLQGGKVGRAIICNDCDVRVGFPQAYDEVHAAEFWNDRKIETEPERHGKWIKTVLPMIEYFKCSNCEYGVTDREMETFDFCPKCGAKMDGGKLS